MTPFLLFFGCPPKDDDSDTEEPNGEDEPGFSLLSEQVGDAMLLSGWSNGDELLAVGGQMGGGTGTLVRYDGTSICTETAVTERALWWIHGPQEGDWYAVGEAGTVLHEVDGVRSREDLPTPEGVTLFGVYATDDEVLAVGGNPLSTDAQDGQVWRRRDGTWTLVQDGLPATLFKVWEDWIVGTGVAYRIDEDTLVEDTPEGAPRLLTVRGRSETDVFAVGGQSSPEVWHHDGTSWSEVDSAGLNALMGVWTAVGEDVWVAGMFGQTAFYDGATWTYPSFPLTIDHFHAVWKHGDEVWFLGGDFLNTTGPNHGTIVRYGKGLGPMTAGPCDR